MVCKNCRQRFPRFRENLLPRFRDQLEGRCDLPQSHLDPKIVEGSLVERDRVVGPVVHLLRPELAKIVGRELFVPAAAYEIGSPIVRLTVLEQQLDGFSRLIGHGPPFSEAFRRNSQFGFVAR